MRCLEGGSPDFVYRFGGDLPEVFGAYLLEAFGVFAAGEIYSHIIVELAHGGMVDGDELWAAAGW